MANNKKLIRLTTNSDRAEFDASFDSEIPIAPNTEIALRGLAFDRSDPLMIVDASNDLITFQAQPGQVHSFHIPNDTYSSANMPAFFQNFSNLMNAESSTGNNKELGLQYYVGTSPEQKFELRAIQNLNFNSANDDNQHEYRYYEFHNIDRVDNTVGSAPTPLKQQVGNVNTIGDYNTSVAYQTIPFTKGCGVYRIRINEMIQPSNSGVLVMGLCNDVQKLQSRTMAVADMEIAIEVVSETANYRVRTPLTQLGGFEDAPPSAGANQTPSTRNKAAVAVDDHDVLEIKLQFNILTAGVHTSNGYSEFARYPYERSSTSPGKDLFPFLSLYKPLTEIKVDAWQNNWDESFAEYATPTVLENSRVLGARRFPRQITANHATEDQPSFAPSTWKLQTNSLELSGFLGWGNTVFGSNGITRSPLFFYDTTIEPQRDLYFPARLLGEGSGVLGENILYSALTSNIYMVEMLNMKLDSYDNFSDTTSKSKRGRSNILAVINANEFNTGNIDRVLLYEPNDPIYISLLNANELSLRNIRARIVNLDYSPVRTFGTSTLTIHLRPSTL